MREYVFLTAAGVLIACIAFITVRSVLRTRRTASNTWQDLLGRLARLNHGDLDLVALDLIEEDGRRRGNEWPDLNPEQIWNLVGGMEGLEKVEANCEIFIEIAMYVQLTYPEAVVVAEDFRRNTRHIQWHVNRLRAGATTGNLHTSFAAYAQRAVASYYLMRKQLIAVCEQADFAGLPELRAAV